MNASVFLKQVFEDWQGLAQAKNAALPELRPASLVIERTDYGLADSGALRGRLKHLAQGEGWLRLQSHLLVCPDDAGQMPVDAMPLEGEWALGSEGAALRFTTNGWTVWTYRESDDGRGDPVLVQDCDMAADLPAGRLRYRLYWGAAAGTLSALRRRVQRFMGFERERQ